jgi:hypothetical protein
MKKYHSRVLSTYKGTVDYPDSTYPIRREQCVWNISAAWRATYNRALPQVALGGIKAPIQLNPAPVDPLALAKQAANALALAERFAQVHIAASAPQIRPWSTETLPPGLLVREEAANVPLGECLAPPRVPSRGRPKKARIRRPQENAWEGISEQELALGTPMPLRTRPGRQVCGVCGGVSHNKRTCTQRQH